MQNKKPWLYLAAVAVVLLALKYSDAQLGGIRLLFSLLVPLLLGCGVAYVLNILVAKLESLPPLRDPQSKLYPVRRALSITGALVGILLVITLLFGIIIPQLVDAFRVMLINVPPAVNEFLAWLDSLDVTLPQLEAWLRSLNLNWPDLLQKATTYLTSGVGNMFTSAFGLLSSLGGIVMQVVIAVIFALYLLAGKERLGRQFHAVAETYLPPRVCRTLWYVLATAHDTFTKFFVGQFTEAIVIGVLCTLGMWLFRLPYATMIGTLVGATALLPVVGAYLGAAVGAFMILTVNPLQALGFLVFIAILQQLEGNLIYPRVVGTSIGLPGIWVLTAVTVGGGIGGIAGMLLAVPVTATLYRLLRADVHRRRQDHEVTSV
ncbi:AI-2E family transporter [uncultured Subdoligranulum sp.]|uniref:AI-2E family transporter n=1 Tax=uncultured Subdoligranulum sp. TaxID=512298 RepID=UPI002635E442|nr:AI-2E family transporter [uncultured Subdoligranulum sp.]